MISLLLLTAIFDRGYCFVLSSKTSLPLPPGADSSLSPKLIRAFYEINFIPTESESIQNRLGDATVQLQDKDCELFPDNCKQLQFTSTKVKTVQKVEDMIGSALSSGDIPVVKGSSVTETEVSHMINEINSMVNKVVPVKGVKKNVTLTSQPEIPVYSGAVDTKAILDRAERPELKFNPPPAGSYPFHEPRRPFYPSGRHYHGWDRPCMRAPCTRLWFHEIQMDPHLHQMDHS